MKPLSALPVACVCVVVASLSLAEAPQTWKPVKGRLTTRWAKDVTEDKVHPEYPRPQMTRADWLNLNGLWDYAITPVDAGRPAHYSGKILVPFPVESALSGVGQMVGKQQRLWYRRTFAVPEKWAGQRLLLHFGAVDWETVVWVNGKEVARHTGGYDPFSCDVSAAVNKKAKQQEVVVSVYDPSDDGTQPRGKQVKAPHSIWYTPVTGIWQTVWIEPVPEVAIESVRLVPDLDTKTLTVTTALNKKSDLAIRVRVKDLKVEASGKAGKAVRLDVSGCKAWSPANPALYDLTMEVLDGDKVVDRVGSYFGLRKVSLGKDVNGITRIFLNNEPLFQYGLLDQGWWPDGLYTAPTDAALRYDLEMTRQLGFNLVRKHVKVEPARWYYHCDRMGLLVWQDMPSGGVNARWPLDGTELTRPEGERKQYDKELTALIDTHRNHPSIVAWVPFNEAWGQFDTVRVTNLTRALDPTRLVISASGGNDFGVGDVHDAHDYPGPMAPPAQAGRASVLGEFGGLGLPLAGHTWQAEKNWGYRSFTDRAKLQEAYLGLIKNLRPLIESRLSAAIYTQTTDVEIEVNGIMTYDRAVTKLDAKAVVAAHRTLYAPLRKLTRAERSAAHTVAYWRFEEGKAGSLVAHDRGKREGLAARDESGNRNHLYAYSSGNAPRHTADVAGAVVPLTGASNKGALDDTAAATGDGTRDLYTDGGRSGVHMCALDTFVFSEWTIEASVKPALLGAEQTIVGKDGKPTRGKQAPLQLMLRKDNRLAIVAVDGRGEVREVASREPVERGVWYHVVAQSDGKNLRLYVRQGKKYARQGEVAFRGELIRHVGTWTVGRGHDDGKIARDARAVIDEVRISSTALPESLLLWSE